MMRKRSLPTPPDPDSRKLVADFLGLEIGDVTRELQEDTYSIFISGNLEAQAKYKECNPFGNTDRPGRFSFKERLLVRWTGRSVKPA